MLPKPFSRKPLVFVITMSLFSGLLGVALFSALPGFNQAYAATQPTKINGLTIALDTLRSTDTPQTIVNFMKQYNYNALRIYMGWCSSLWTGNVNAPMNTRTQNYINEVCRLCAQNNYTVVCAVSMQVTPFKTAFPNEIQVGPNGEQNSQGNWVCPSGPNFQTFTRNLVRILVNIMEKHATPRISVDELVFVTGGGRPTFYSQSMRNLYQQKTGKSIPIFSSTYGSYDTEKRQFIEFAKSTIRDFYLDMKAVAKAENLSTIYQALIDTYWVYPRTSYDTEPWDFYGSSNLDEITYEWFYAIQGQNWAGITNGLQRIKNLNPTANHYFIYGTSTMTSISNMRQAVELTMAQDYDGVYLYEYAKTRNNPFDVSDIVLSGQPPPSPTPTPTPSPTPTPTNNFLFQDSFESRSLSNWNTITRTYGETATVNNYNAYAGTYHARFATTGLSQGHENAYINKDVNLQNVYARGYFRFSSYQGRAITNDNDDRLYLIRFSNSQGNLAWAGIRRENGVNKWMLFANEVMTSSAVPISTDQWYCVELHWNATQRAAELLVNGIKILGTTLNTGSTSNITEVDMGIIYTYNIQGSLILYGDCFNISDQYIGSA